MSIVANIRSTQIRNLRDAGIWTIDGLAAYAGPSVKGMPDAVLTAQENKIVMPSAFSPLQ